MSRFALFRPQNIVKWTHTHTPKRESKVALLYVPSGVNAETESDRDGGDPGEHL